MSDETRAELQRAVDRVVAPSSPSCPVTTVRKEATASDAARTFAPRVGRPVLVALVNEGCGSDCEFVTSVLARLPETIVVGVNSFGIMKFVQPSYFILPNTRLPFRIARGTSDAYGDGRSIDGYGLGVDVLLPTQASQTRGALVQLARTLAGRRH